MDHGIGLLEQYAYEKAYEVFEELVERFPDWVAARVNLALAALNAEQHRHKAEDLFRSALDLDPKCCHALQGLGVVYSHFVRPQEAREVLSRLVELDPRDPHGHYFLGRAYKDLEQVEEAKRHFEAAVHLQPSFGSAWHGLMDLHRTRESMEQLRGYLAEFQRLSSASAAIIVGFKYGEGGKYLLAIRNSSPPGMDADEADPAESRTRPLEIGPVVPFAPPPVVAQRPDGQPLSPASALADLNGDESLEVLLCGQASIAGGGPVVGVFGADASGGIRRLSEIPCAAVVCAAGDLDGDSDADVVAAGPGWLRAFANDGGGNLAERPLGDAARLPGFPLRLYVLDADSDWDLDILLLVQEAVPGEGVESRIVLLNNNRDLDGVHAAGTFSDISVACGFAAVNAPLVELAAADWDGDIDTDLLVVDGASGAAHVFANDRVWRYRSIDPALQPRAPGLRSLATGDLNGDGREDLLLCCGDRLQLWRNRGELCFEADEDFARRFGALGGSAVVVFDFAQALRNGAVVLDARPQGQDRPRAVFIRNLRSEAQPLPLLQLATGEAWGAAATAGLLDPQAGVQLVGCDTSNGAWTAGVSAQGPWLGVDLKGPGLGDVKPEAERANAAGIGATVEVRAGSRTLVQQLHGGAGGTARSAPRLACGLGGQGHADYVRVLWPDGVLQSELALTGGKLHSIHEKDRKPTSCPVLFAWDGEKFAFVADFLGVGGLGYFESPGRYHAPDPTEILHLPRLEVREAPTGGGLEYELRVLEPLEECTYLDAASLVAVDHPDRVTVLPLEMFAVSGPVPQFEILAFESRCRPERAWDQDGVDVTAQVVDLDGDFAPALRRDGRFRGVLKETQSVEFDFADGIASLLAQASTAPAEARPVLFLHGYIEYGYSTTNFAAFQAGFVPRAPSFAAERAGRWVGLRDDWGFPAGYPRWMAVDFDGLLLGEDRRLRVETNLEVAWDQVFLALAWPARSLPEVELDPDRAELRYRGFPREALPWRDEEGWVYEGFRAWEHFKVMPGSYTRFGDVAELLRQRDDRFVVFGAGDEVALAFKASRLPALEAGMRRSFFFKSTGYCKDMDLYTAHPEGVEPLPFSGTRSYPYPQGDGYPEREDLRRYRAEWNTRVVEGSALTPLSDRVTRGWGASRGAR
jgi:hypothetical protein